MVPKERDYQKLPRNDSPEVALATHAKRPERVAMCCSHGVLRSLQQCSKPSVLNSASQTSNRSDSQLVLAVPLRHEPQLSRDGIDRVDPLVDAVRRHRDDGKQQRVGLGGDVLGGPL